MKFDDILFFILIALIVGTALWLLHGSPLEADALIAISIAIAASELLIWRAIFKMDKKTSIGFMKIKNDFNALNNKLDNKFSNIEKSLNNFSDRLINLERRRK